MLGSDFYSLFVCLGVTISFSRYALSRGLPPRYAGEDWHRRWPQTSYCKYDMKAQGALSDLNFPLFQYPNPYTNLPNWPPQKSFPVDLSESNPGPCKASNLYVHSITWNGKFPCPPLFGVIEPWNIHLSFSPEHPSFLHVVGYILCRLLTVSPVKQKLEVRSEDQNKSSCVIWARMPVRS